MLSLGSNSMLTRNAAFADVRTDTTRQSHQAEFNARRVIFLCLAFNIKSVFDYERRTSENTKENFAPRRKFRLAGSLGLVHNNLNEHYVVFDILAVIQAIKRHKQR